MVKRLINMFLKKLKTGIEGVISDNGGSKVEYMKEMLEREDVKGVEAVGWACFEDDGGMKRVSTELKDFENVDETWFYHQ